MTSRWSIDAVARVCVHGPLYRISGGEAAVKPGRKGHNYVCENVANPDT